MALYRYTITPRGAFGTPLRSDTLHGQLLCAAAELDGSAAVAELIAAFAADRPPFVCSSAFPTGMLPMPCLPPLSRGAFRERFCAPGGIFEGNMVKALNAHKAFRKLAHVPVDLWAALRHSLSQAELFERWRQNPDAFRPRAAQAEEAWQRNQVEAHNSIDRATGAVLQEGGLFVSEATFYATGARLDLYVRTEDPAPFERLLGHVAATGFGRDTSTGKGWFAFARDKAFVPDELDADGPFCMSLSLFSAMDLSAVSGWYRVFAKSGRVWGALGESNPFKQAFLAMEEGSVFKSLPTGGYLLQGLHPDPRIVQVAHPLCLAFTPAKEVAT